MMQTMKYMHEINWYMLSVGVHNTMQFTNKMGLEYICSDMYQKPTTGACISNHIAWNIVGYNHSSML